MTIGGELAPGAWNALAPKIFLFESGREFGSRGVQLMMITSSWNLSPFFLLDPNMKWLWIWSCQGLFMYSSYGFG